MMLNKAMKQLENSKTGRLLVQFIKFGMVGVSNTLISLAATYAVMAVFHFVFSLDTLWALGIATTVGYVVGVCNSYFLNKRYVFRNSSEKNQKKVLFKVFVCYGATYLLSMLIMNLLVKHLMLPSIIAPIPRLIITIPLNFVANKLWAFKDY